MNLNGDITGVTVAVAGSGDTYFGQSGSGVAGYYNGATINLASSGTNYFYNGLTNTTLAVSDGTNYFYNGITGATIAASAGTTNFNAAITSSTITASGGTQTFSNSLESSTITGTGGIQNLNAAITASTINVSGSTMNLASTGSIATSALNLNSGTLNLQNGHTDTLNVTDFSANSAATLKFDVNLLTGINDKIATSGSAVGTITGVVNVTQDYSTNETRYVTLVTGSDLSNLHLATINNVTTTYGNYTFADAGNGIYDVTMAWLHGLNSAVAIDTLDTRTYNTTADETVIANLGDMGRANSTLNVVGNGYNINGVGYAGVNVLAGQTLNISSAGSLDGSHAVVTAWNGFSSSANGGAINNAGTLNVDNSVFANNATTVLGGALYNSGIATLTDTTFSANTAAADGGGAIYNAGTLYIKAAAAGYSAFKTSYRHNQTCRRQHHLPQRRHSRQHKHQRCNDFSRSDK